MSARSSGWPRAVGIAASVPVACPAGRSATGTHGHFRTSGYTGSRAEKQADPQREPAFQAAGRGFSSRALPREGSSMRGHLAHRLTYRCRCAPCPAARMGRCSAKVGSRSGRAFRTASTTCALYTPGAQAGTDAALDTTLSFFEAAHLKDWLGNDASSGTSKGDGNADRQEPDAPAPRRSRQRFETSGTYGRSHR